MTSDFFWNYFNMGFCMALGWMLARVVVGIAQALIVSLMMMFGGGDSDVS